MREIKFRGLDKKRNEWVYGFYHAFGDKTYIIEYGKPGIPEQHIEVLPETIGQFTELYDSNTKEIYEGDILKTDNVDDKSTAEVKFMNGCYIAWCECIGDNEWRGYKVIGNIYENPELLEQPPTKKL